ncbi:SusC/RagA family TonB-linked outer membrane protein [Bacteroidia bacterium]|nr:SusC/RagA family TonB-linked outer membrane protein [Bacteroidia bacterium]
MTETILKNVRLKQTDIKDRKMLKTLKLGVLSLFLFYPVLPAGASLNEITATTETQQQGSRKVIKGVVTDEYGEVLPGVSVLVKGTQTGTVADSRGHYQLTVENPSGSTLVFSYVGMQKKEIKIGQQSELNVSLSTDGTLDEVVVTGYQTISRERATGSFDIIDKQFIEKPTTNIATALVGTVNGIQGWVDLNGDPTFEVRGQTRLDPDGNSPLIVVDGFAIEGDFKYINPTDVESITVLKDAAASSIWGARAANGVIVITTKRGKKSTRIEVSSLFKVAPKADLDYARPIASSAEVVEYEKLAFNKWSGRLLADGIYDMASFSPGLLAMNEHYLGYITEQERNSRLESYKNYDNSDQIRKYLLQNPVTHQQSVNIYGGSDRITNVLSLLYEEQGRYMKGAGVNKISVNYRSDVNLFRWLDFNFSGTYVQNKETGKNGIVINNLASDERPTVTSYTIPDITPYEMLVNPDGSRTNLSNGNYQPNLDRYVPTSRFPYSNWGYNPITEMENSDLTVRDINARVQAGLTFKIWKGITLDSKVQYELTEVQNRNLYNENTYFVRDKINKAATWDGTPNGTISPNLSKGSILYQTGAERNTWYFRNQLNINQVFAEKHAINFVGGTEISDAVYRTTNYPTTYGYDDDKLTVGTFPNGPGGTGNLQIKNWQMSNQTFTYTGKFFHTTDRFFSLYGNLAYTFDNKYTLSGSARTQASNLITDDPAYRYEPFWSIGGSWQAGREEFLKSKSWIDRLNLRLTYGYGGNVDKTTSFKPLINVAATPNVYTNERTATISSYGNPTLRWEKTGTLNFGIDYSFFNGQLNGKIDIYDKKSKDLIVAMSIPAINGTTSQKLNAGEMSNKGIELEIGTRQQLSKQISWRGNLNLSYNKNKITKLFKATYQGYELTDGGTAAYVEGHNTQTLWSFKYAGIRNDGTEQNPNWQPKIQGAGDDVYGFGGWPPGDGRDFCLDMGTKVAPWVAGFTNNFTYKDLTFSFIVTGKFGHKFNRQSFNYPVVWGARVLPNTKLDEVRNGDPNKIVPLPLNGDTEDRFYFWDRFYPYLDYLAENANHVRLQEVSLYYNLPTKILSKLGFEGLQIYGQVNNALSLYANGFNEDPEFPKGSMKPQPNYTFGVKFQF